MEIGKTQKLDDIVDIKAGYSFRSALKQFAEGNVFVVQAKDVRKCLYIDMSKLGRIMMDYKNDRLLRQKDIILSTRGFFDAAVFKSEKAAIASASVYILRLKTDEVLPEYLVIFLKSRHGQLLIRQYETGGAIKTILIKDLRNIRLPIPDKKTQETIIALYENIKKQKNLTKEKIRLQEEIFNGIL